MTVMHDRRLISVWLPAFATDRIARRRPETRARPTVVILPENGRMAVVAVNRAAAALGVAPGQGLSDARALCPGALAVEAEPGGDARALAKLADWAGRYTPWAAVDPAAGSFEGGLRLDITGCAHLFGGEAALLEDLGRRLTGFGLAHRLATAPTPGAAWAWARFGAPDRPVLAPASHGELAESLAPLPVAALRLPAADADLLVRLGLRRVGDLYGLPRAALAARFGDRVRRRLDQALGHEAEPISPRRQVPPRTERFVANEPLVQPDDVARILDSLLVRLCRRLEAEGRGARRLVYTLYRVDGTTAEAAIGTSRASREPAHLARLFAPRLEGLDPDPGIDAALLAATASDLLRPHQVQVATDEGAVDGGAGRRPELAEMIDRLANRLGSANVFQLAPQERALPEARSVSVPALDTAPTDWTAWPTESFPPPLRLFAKPQPVELPDNEPEDFPLKQTPTLSPQGRGDPTAPSRVSLLEAETSDPFPQQAGPPARFRWRRRTVELAAATGPERVVGPWWAGDARWRDYWRVEDADGRRLWLFQDLASGRWHVHGLFR